MIAKKKAPTMDAISDHEKNSYPNVETE